MKKLLIVAGAGASVEFGMPSVGEIDYLFNDWALEILPLKDDNTKSLYTWVKEQVENYASQNKRNRMGAIMNFESILFTIQNLSGLHRDEDWQSFNNRIMPFVDLKDVPEVMRFGQERIANGDDFAQLQSYLIDKLLVHIREKCSTLRNDKSVELDLLSDFFNELKKKYEIGIINLNYDNVILSALPDIETGYDRRTGTFSRDRLNSTNWNFCFHMHGSVHFDMKGSETELHKIQWNDDLKSVFSSNSSGRSGIDTTEGVHHIQSSIITGLDKANQILREPFGPYFMRIDHLVHEADAILFLGYGFADMHLNKMFPFMRTDGKLRKVAVIDWANDDEDGLSFRHDDWTFGLFNTVPFNGSEMNDGLSREPNAAIHFKQNLILEKSSNADYPLAVWYNGLLEACRNPQKIIDELE
jgi:hypothetical protein